MRLPFFEAKWKRDWRRIAERLQQVATEYRVMHDPRIDWEAHQLVEGALRIDMLNVYHVTRQLEDAETETILRTWMAPAHLGNACYYGRVDAVIALLASGACPDGHDFGGHPIDAAKEAYVTTPLHAECVRVLLDAGARITPHSFSLNPESVGSEADFGILDVVVSYGLEHSDPAVRAAAEAANIEDARASFRQMRGGSRRAR